MILLVGLGGMIGALCRFYIGKWFNEIVNHKFPVGTFIINLTGCILLGLLSKYYVSGIVPNNYWLFFGTGLLGAYTTFSTFGYETITLVLKKEYKYAFLYVFTSIILGILGAYIGIKL